MIGFAKAAAAAAIEEKSFNLDLLCSLNSLAPPPPPRSPSPQKTNSSRRTWKPNVQQKSLWLSAAGRHVRLPVTTTALRAIDKSGGLDSFLLNTKPAKLDPAARALRDWLVGWNAAKVQLFKSSRGGEVAAAAAASEASEAAPAVSPP